MDGYSWRAQRRHSVLNLDAWRCTRCGKLMMRLSVQVGTVEVKCRECNTVHILEAGASTSSLEGGGGGSVLR